MRYADTFYLLGISLQDRDYNPFTRNGSTATSEATETSSIEAEATLALDRMQSLAAAAAVATAAEEGVSNFSVAGMLAPLDASLHDCGYNPIERSDYQTAEPAATEAAATEAAATGTEEGMHSLAAAAALAAEEGVTSEDETDYEVENIDTDLTGYCSSDTDAMETNVQRVHEEIPQVICLYSLTSWGWLCCWW